MGAWKELDTEISVELDFSDLDEILGFGDDFEPLKQKVTNLKKKIEKGSKRAISELAKKNVSWQEKYINKHCKNPTGMLATSIDYNISNNGFTAITGTRFNHIYPMSIEYGHKDIFPIRAKALVFAPPKDWKGPVVKKGPLAGRVVLKKVNATKPRPFVAPAYRDTEKVAEEMFIREIGHAGMKWD